MRYRALASKAGKCYVVNEAHGLRKDTIRLLLVFLERLPEHVVWVFTTTKAGQASLFENDPSGDASPLVSRCVEVVLENGEATRNAMAARARAIAGKEGMDGLPESVYRRAIEATSGNMRQLLQRVESGAFRADARVALERELDMVASTKGEYAQRQRETLKAALAKL